MRFLHKRNTFLFLSCFSICSALLAQGPSAPPDVLIFVDGEKLIGHLERATDTSVVFKSDIAGEVTAPWSKVQELQSGQKFAAIPKGVKLRRGEDTAAVPKGTITGNAQSVQVTQSSGAAQQSVPVNSLGQLVPLPEFEGAFERKGLLNGWVGGATGGVSLTEATQKNQTFSGTVNLVRAVPAENWLSVRSRTIFDFNEAYSKLTQPGTPALKTSLFRSDLEQDYYSSPRFFVFGQAMFDHSVSQGLDLQQTYGGGVGLVVLKGAKQELDFKASADYVDQQFEDSTLNKTLVGSIFSETYVRTFAHGILLNEQGGITPAWNDTSAYSAFANAGVTFPVYHHFGLTVGGSDNFLNDPPPGFKKNSFQLTIGATYSFRQSH